jgi:small subunit ribosomal protein S5
MGRRGNRKEKLRGIDKEAWEPKTKIGLKVKNGEITTIEEVIESGKPILEPEIVDVLLPEMEAENLKINTTQRVTDSGKRTKFRVVTVIGDKKGHVGLGVGKSDELKPAMDYAIKDAKKNMISVLTGCGSWECKCAFRHSVLSKTEGKEGSTVVTLQPAPRGLGLAANHVVKKVLNMAGVKDVWSSMHGGRNVYNMAAATILALDNLNLKKPRVE